MKLLRLTHKSIIYEFRLLERARVIQVTKAERFHYNIVNRSGLFICDCPGGVYHKKCWHTGVIGALKMQESINTFEAQLAEEAGLMQYRKED